jgi:hypothetical protein
MPKPIIKIAISTGKRRPVMPFPERLDDDTQNASSEQATMPPERCHKLPGRWRRIGNGFEKSVPVAAGEHHSPMFVQHPASAFVSQVARSQPRKSHCSTDELLGRGADAKLDAFSLGLATSGQFAPCRCCHEVLLGLSLHVREYAVRDKNTVGNP